MAGQVAYHLMAQAGMARAPWAVTTVVSCLPVLVLAMGTALAHMLRADAEALDAPDKRDRTSSNAAAAARSPEDEQDRSGPQAAGDGSGPDPKRGPERRRFGVHGAAVEAQEPTSGSPAHR